MSRRNLAHVATAAAAAVLLSAVPATAAPGTGVTGPSTTTPPYVLPVADGVQTTSVLTAGDTVPKAGGGNYRMVGVPDALGAFQGSGSNFRLLMNHELQAAQGVAHVHGFAGSFVSDWQINRKTYQVVSGADYIKSGVLYYDYATSAFSTTLSASAFVRFCSGSLTETSALYNPASGNGYSGRLYFANEENGANGRTFAVDEAGNAQQAPRLGRASWENNLLASTTNDVTLVQANEDDASGQIWTYVGAKQASGSPMEKAGLDNGKLYVMDAVDSSVATDAQLRASYGKNVPVEVAPVEVNWDQSGSALNTEAAGKGITLTRIEDGAWDPNRPNDYYFLTTEGGSTAVAPDDPSSRDGGGLWRLRYHDVNRPLLGATLTLLLDGSETPYLSKPDNMAIDTHGHMLIQEDPGGNAHIARIVAYDLASRKRAVVAAFDPAQFSGASAVTIDEESSGMIDALDTVGDGRFLFDAQVHKNISIAEPEIVEMGQLLVLDVDWDKVFPVTAAAGPAGPAGPAGATGPAGGAGAAGTPGATGASGAPGTNGTNGAAGPAGAAGPTGAAGRDGAPGQNGASGAPGQNGRDGSVTCKVSRSGRSVACKVTYAAARAQSARLVRAGRAVARGKVSKNGTVSFFTRTRLKKGSYTLVVGSLRSTLRVR